MWVVTVAVVVIVFQQTKGDAELSWPKLEGRMCVQKKKKRKGNERVRSDSVTGGCKGGH